MSIFKQLRIQWGIDPVMVGIFTGSFLLYGLAWWLRQSTLRFNIAVFEISGGILMVNVALTAMTARKEITLGYLLAGATLFTQILLLILIWKASQGASL